MFLTINISIWDLYVCSPGRWLIPPVAQPISPCDPLVLQQAPCAKKKAKPQAKEVSEEVVPQTAKDKVTEGISNLLKEVGVARTAAITLQGLEYAENLSQAIKSHADGIEAFYSDVQQTLKGSTSDKELAKVLHKIEEKSQSTKKLQAGWLSVWHMS